MRPHDPEFFFNGRNYGYFVHPINETGSNERCVEVPISVPHAVGKVFEFGNVLTQYGFGWHPVLDLKDGSIREDIRTWTPTEEYDVCISISTLEHVGEGTQYIERDLKLALAKLKSCCKRLFATIPLGYSNTAVEVCEQAFSDKWYMKRTAGRRWVQVEEKPLNCAYGSPFGAANGLLIGGWS